jgi:predicted ATPase
MRFFEFETAAMRRPSVPGQTVLGDRGENLSSVLEAIHQDDETKEQLASWIRELTPMDVVDFKFPRDLQGRTQVVLVEGDAREVSAESASAGTLRLLAMLASVLGPEHARTSFFEELETGIHPARLYLLIDLIEQNVSDDPAATTQVIATTHSPQALRFLSETTLTSTSVVYREEGISDASITPVLDIPHVRDALERKDLGRLFESGWMENSLSFARTNES